MRDLLKTAKLSVDIFLLFLGNVGKTFSIDPILGTVTLAKPLDRAIVDEYLLVVKATDRGAPPLGNTSRVRVTVTVSDNAPPKFDRSEYAIELQENLPAGKFLYNSLFHTNCK